ncbi:MAG: hypothetical protein L6V81_01650 [Clostridium sp.]|nr:MAG: hypothetical protein L6V81_01650 [Clostridium sp.]
MIIKKYHKKLFLEILTNYNRYVELFTYMISNNYKLTKDDKNQFRINIKSRHGSRNKKNLKDLDKAKR